MALPVDCDCKHNLFMRMDRYVGRMLGPGGIYPSLKPQEPSILISEEGCLPQAAHLDWAFEPHSLLEAYKQSNCDFPMSAILAVQRNTRIDIWPASHLLFKTYAMMKYSGKSTDEIKQWASNQQAINAQRVPIPRGCMILFRQDLVHAGSSYQIKNIRMFQFYNTEGMKSHKGCINYIHLYDEIKHLFT